MSTRKVLQFTRLGSYSCKVEHEGVLVSSCVVSSLALVNCRPMNMTIRQRTDVSTLHRSRSHDDNLLEPDLQRENVELKRDVESLRCSKNKLAEKNSCLKNHVQKLELQLSQYKKLYEKIQSDSVTSDKMEIEKLRQQLEVVLLVKEALHDENLELRHRLENSQLQERHASPGACVVCMDNPANVVCMPCRLWDAERVV